MIGTTMAAGGRSAGSKLLALLCSRGGVAHGSAGLTAWCATAAAPSIPHLAAAGAPPPAPTALPQQQHHHAAGPLLLHQQQHHRRAGSLVTLTPLRGLASASAPSPQQQQPQQPDAATAQAVASQQQPGSSPEPLSPQGVAAAAAAAEAAPPSLSPPSPEQQQQQQQQPQQQGGSYSINPHLMDARSDAPLMSAQFPSSGDDKFGVQKNWFTALYKQLNYMAKTGAVPGLKGRQRAVFEQVGGGRWRKGGRALGQAVRRV